MPYSNDDFWDINGVLWVQPAGPNTKPQYLGCHDLDGPTEPKGTTVKGLCIDPISSRKFNVVSAVKGPPDAPTATIATTVAKTADWLAARHGCPMPIYVHLQACDPRNSFLNLVRGSVLQYADVQTRTRANLARGRFTEGDSPARAEQTFDLQMDVVEDYFTVTIDRIEPSYTQDAAVRDLVFYDVTRCQGPCGEFQDVCNIGYAVCDAASTATANVMETLDKGVTWATTGADPFGTNEHIASIVCIPKGAPGDYRLVVANGVTGGGNAEIAWSDDGGDTWNNVIMPTGAAGDFAQWCGALFMLDYYHVWFACGQAASGRIYFSSDGGVSWVEQEDAAVHPFYYVKFSDFSYGLAVGGAAAAGIIYHTTDGGAHWSAIAEPAAQDNICARCCEILDNHRFWVGYADGEIWYTFAGGMNMLAGDWAERAVDTPSSHVATNRINDIMATDDFNIWFVAVDDKETADDALGASIHRSWDGGYDWQVWDFGPFAESGDTLACIWVCNYDKSWSGGDLIGGQATLYVSVPATT